MPDDPDPAEPLPDPVEPAAVDVDRAGRIRETQERLRRETAARARGPNNYRPGRL